MAKYVLVGLLVLCGPLFAEEKFRVEKLSSQWIEGRVQIVAYHDKESGVEILCFYTSDKGTGMNTSYSPGVSCVPTGRKW